MDIKPMKHVKTDWDNLIIIFASKFDDKEWAELLEQTPHCSDGIDGVPADTLSVLYSLFGKDRGIRWLYHDRTYRNEPIIDFLRSYPNKALAAKAVNYRVYMLYKRNLNNSFLNTLKSNYRNWSWETFISDSEKNGYYHKCEHHIEGVDQSVVNFIYSSKLTDEDKAAFFSAPIYELHGRTPIELSQSEEGKKALQLYIQYFGALKVNSSGI